MKGVTKRSCPLVPGSENSPLRSSSVSATSGRASDASPSASAAPIAISTTIATPRNPAPMASATPNPASTRKPVPETETSMPAVNSPNHSARRKHSASIISATAMNCAKIEGSSRKKPLARFRLAPQASTWSVT